MKKLNKGFTLVELLVVIGILGVLMGTLFPAITGAMRSANMTACMQNGKNLHTAIFTRNTARDSLGLGSVWPQNGQTESSEDDDISAMSFNNSADYFTELFDLANAGDSQNHKPEIEVDMKLLWGFGVNPPRAGTTKFESRNILWAIAANIPDNAPDFVPVLASRNINCAKLLNKMSTSSSTEIGLGSNGGSTYDTPFSSKGCVYITRGGGAVKIDNSRDFIYRVVYSQKFDLTSTSSDQGAFCYLTPDSKATPTSN